MLDHDIFLIDDFDISNRLEQQPFYGIKHRFYLWPGLFFIRMDYSRGKKMDFRPSLHLHGDTGACNYYSLFKDVIFSDYELVKEEHVCFEGYSDVFEHGYSRFDREWIHCWNVSNYMGKKNMSAKMNKIYQMLEERLK